MIFHVRVSRRDLDRILTPFLAPDRLGKISKFGADAFAVMQATPIQSTLSMPICVSRILNRPSSTEPTH